MVVSEDSHSCLLFLVLSQQLFGITPMSSKQSRHYQAMKADKNNLSKETGNFENLEAYFKSLNPGLGLISENHGVYRLVLAAPTSTCFDLYFNSFDRAFLEALHSDNPKRLYSATCYYQRYILLYKYILIQRWNFPGLKKS